MGIDHSNPYIHSTTVLCDNGRRKVHTVISVSIHFPFMVLRLPVTLYFGVLDCQVNKRNVITILRH